MRCRRRAVQRSCGAPCAQRRSARIRGIYRRSRTRRRSTRSPAQSRRPLDVRLAVVGTGGVGAYIGGRLARAGADVHFLARGEHLAALRERGLRVRSILGDFALPVDATDDSNEIGPCDLVLFCVKSFDTETAAAALPSLLRSETGVLSLQNGVDNEGEARDRDRTEPRAGR